MDAPPNLSASRDHIELHFGASLPVDCEVPIVSALASIDLEGAAYSPPPRGLTGTVPTFEEVEIDATADPPTTA